MEFQGLPPSPILFLRGAIMILFLGHTPSDYIEAPQLASVNGTVPSISGWELPWKNRLGEGMKLWCVLPRDFRTLASCQRTGAFRIGPLKVRQTFRRASQISPPSVGTRTRKELEPDENRNFHLQQLPEVMGLILTWGAWQVAI